MQRSATLRTSALSKYRILPAAAFFFAFSATISAQAAPPSFTVQRIASGVYALIRREPPSLWFNPNNIFIIGKKDVIVL